MESVVISKTLEFNDKYEYLLKHLMIINAILPVQMTNKEMEVIAAFINEEDSLGKDVFSTLGRKRVMTLLSLKPGGLSNYLNQLKEKGFIKEVNKELKIIDLVKPLSNSKTYKFKIVYNNDSN